MCGARNGPGRLRPRRLGAGAFLASYSRDNERQADALGTEYMVKAGYSPDGMVGLMEMLNSLNKSNRVPLR